MRVYSVHIKPLSLALDRDAVLVKEGFSLPAFVFTFVWALWHGMWLAGALILIAGIAVQSAGALAGLDPLSQSALGLGFAAIVGFGANDWRRRGLARQGYGMEGWVAAQDSEAALRRYFDLHPEALGGEFLPSSA